MAERLSDDVFAPNLPFKGTYVCSHSGVLYVGADPSALAQRLYDDFPAGHKAVLIGERVKVVSAGGRTKALLSSPGGPYHGVCDFRGRICWCGGWPDQRSAVQAFKAAGGRWLLVRVVDTVSL